MKWIAFMILMFYSIARLKAQEPPVVIQQSLENKAEQNGSEAEDDDWLQDLDQFRKDRININTASENELNQLHLLTVMQINSLLTYRRLLGEFLSLYELQAVPGWDLLTIKKLLPFLTIQSAVPMNQEIIKRLQEGAYSFVSRVSQVIQRSEGYRKGHYNGSPQHLYFRFRYNYKNLLQWGILGDKDAGESFFRGKQKWGFDLYSFHFFLRKSGIIQSLAIGDYTVNLGQGLIQWQSLSFKKTSEVINIKRQSETIRPYSSSGEFYFNRGAGITLGKKYFLLTGFVSLRKLSSNLVLDSINNGTSISSFQSSGYHRTMSENADRNNVDQFFYGGSLAYQNGGKKLGLNFIRTDLSLPVKKAEESYNLFAIRGRHWCNASLDAGYTFRNSHMFGEFAVDKNFKKALLAGIMISADRKVDLSFLYRNIDHSYQTMNGNAFTESPLPTNEKGIYTGISIRPSSTWRINAYADFFSFPWLRYRVDGPSYGKDVLIQVDYDPDKQTEIYFRFHRQTKGQNGSLDNTNAVLNGTTQNVRFHISRIIGTDLTIRQRVEISGFLKEGKPAEYGFLWLSDVLYHPIQKPYGLDLRMQYFETGSYDSRIYAFENDVQYSFTMPAFSGKGGRYYVLISYDLNRKVTLWVRWSSSIFPGQKQVGEADDQIIGNKRSEIKFQFRRIF